MSVTRHALKLALRAADAVPPLSAANSDARSTVTTAMAANVSQRFLTWMNPPLQTPVGLASGPILAPFTDAWKEDWLVRRGGVGALELVLGDEHSARLRPFVRRDDAPTLEHVDEP